MCLVNQRINWICQVGLAFQEEAEKVVWYTGKVGL